MYAHLQDLANKCYKKMDDTGKQTSWTKANYPNSRVFLRIQAIRKENNQYPKIEPIKGEIKGNVSIKLWENDVHFSSKQIEEFLVEKILLGVKE